MSEIKSNKAIYVCQHAPESCHIWFTCKGCLIYTRERCANISSNVGTIVASWFTDLELEMHAVPSTVRHVVVSQWIKDLCGISSRISWERREKLSEDFIFRMLPTEMEEAGSSVEPRGIFSLDAPSASICLLIQLEKLATEEGGVTPSVYSRKEPVHLTEREKQKLQVWSWMMPYRESFAWAIIPLFDSSISASGGAASPSSPLTHSMSGTCFQEGVSENSVVVEVSNLNKVKENYTEDLLQDPKRKVHKPVKGVLRLEIEKFQPTTIDFENASESGSVTSYPVDHGDHVADSRFTKLSGNGLDGPHGKEQPQNRMI